ncbi:MAG: hypothetical protein OEN23_19590 [Paracoccaceae bacterium]|nr:hypothetical protein [Paracoccaceae bacterium]
MTLRFDRKNPRFLGGSLGGAELEAGPSITSLADLPKRLSAPMRPLPLICPERTEPQLEEEYAGLREWCETPEGAKHGPARAWFSTGLYLMHRGAWRNGTKIGNWLECDRFERCRWVAYGG